MRDSTKKHHIWIESQRNLPTRGVFVDENKSLLENLIQLRVDISHSCGGHGTCGTCRILVSEGIENFSELSEVELEMKNDRGFSASERLCCQSYLKGSAKIIIP